jgi:hypothetical protein
MLLAAFRRDRRTQATETDNKMADSDLVLVYQHRSSECKDRLVEGHGLVSRGTLNKWLKDRMQHRAFSTDDPSANSRTDPDFHLTEKRLTSRHVTIYGRDLRPKDQQAGESGVTLDQNLASFDVHWRDWLVGRYRTLFIVSSPARPQVPEK